MWLPLRELVGRLNNHFKKGTQGDFKISFDGALPLQEYFELVDMHFNVSLQKNVEYTSADTGHVLFL